MKLMKLWMQTRMDSDGGPGERSLINATRALALAVFLSVFLVTAAIAGQAPVSGKPAVHQGVKNSKKVMVSTKDRYKKMADVRKKAQAKKAQARAGK